MKDRRDLANIYMHVASGHKYHPFAPRPWEIDIEVIAHHLATRARYNGATRHPTDPTRILYSVAEHSVFVAAFVESILERPDLALTALLHDAAEAYNGDLIRPLKYSKEFAAPFKRVETRNERAIAEKFGLVYPFPPEVKLADEAVCVAEIEQVVPKAEGHDWNDGRLHLDVDPAPYTIRMLHPFEAKILFLNTYRALTEKQEKAA